jgi:glucokinase
MGKMYLGIDLGGTQVKIAVVSATGEIVESSTFANYPGSIPEKVVDEIVLHARRMKNFKKLSGTGVGVAGDIDQKKGAVRFSPNLIAWKNIPLRRMLERRQLPKPVVIDNDANVAALGAFWLEAKGKVRNLVCVTLGTGVGGGVVCEGKLYRGATGSAGEIGHMPLDPNGPQCNCGSQGCIERYVGAPYISIEAQELVKGGKSKIMYNLVEGNIAAITPAIVAEAANIGDPIANKIWQQAGERLGIVLAGVINLINPEIIVLAGGVSRAGNLILKPIKDTVNDRAFRTAARACRIVISKYDQKLGVVGAALLAK